MSNGSAWSHHFLIVMAEIYSLHCEKGRPYYLSHGFHSTLGAPAIVQQKGRPGNYKYNANSMMRRGEGGDGILQSFMIRYREYRCIKWLFSFLRTFIIGKETIWRS